MLFNIGIKHYTYIYCRLIVRINHIMEISRISNQAILVMLGERFLQARLNEGLEQIAERLTNFAEQVSQERYSIAPFLSLMVSDKKKFYDL